MRGNQNLAVGDRHGGIGEGGRIRVSPEGAAGPVVILVVAGPDARRAGGLAGLVGNRLPDHMAAEIDFPGLGLGRHAPGDRRGNRLRIVGGDRDQHPLAIGAEGEDMVASDHHGAAEMTDEVVLDVDLRAVGIFFQTRDHVVEHPRLTDDVVDERLECPEDLGEIPLEAEPAGGIPRHPRRGGER